MTDTAIWMGFGFFGQLMFTGRFALQWFASERARKSIVPVGFWYLSILGSAILLAYAIHRRDPVFILGQAFGFMVYFRNLWLIRKHEKRLSPAD